MADPTSRVHPTTHGTTPASAFSAQVPSLRGCSSSALPPHKGLVSLSCLAVSWGKETFSRMLFKEQVCRGAPGHGLQFRVGTGQEEGAGAFPQLFCASPGDPGVTGLRDALGSD